MVDTPMTLMFGSPFNSATAEPSLRHDTQPGVQNQKRTSVPTRLSPSMVPPPMRVAVNSSSSGMPIWSKSSCVVSCGSAMAESTAGVVGGTVVASRVPDEHATANNSTLTAIPMIRLT